MLRVILVIRSGHSVIKQLSQNKHETTLASILLLMVILLTVGSSMMIFIEQQSPTANIKDGGDALWWALVTISTVGYGDHYPVTTAGKLLAASLIICGVGLFGMISGLITSMIVAPRPMHYLPPEQSEKLLHEILIQQQAVLSRLEKLEEKINKDSHGAL
jgi:voltage-gated potassium channel